eukprot:1547710-Pyramimonas_sp.AAC.1
MSNAGNLGATFWRGKRPEEEQEEGDQPGRKRQEEEHGRKRKEESRFGLVEIDRFAAAALDGRLGD